MGGQRAELRRPGAPAVANPGDPAPTWSGPPRLIRSLDLVVTIDTMVVHLAGALGVPVWLLLSARAGLALAGGRSRQPMVPNVAGRYQQKRPGDWEDAVQELGRGLDRATQRHSVAGT